MRAWLPDARGHRRLFSALSIDALGTGLFLPFSILYFTATTDLTLGRVGLALSIAALVRIPATPGAGMFCDRFGARSTVVVSNLIQAVGFFNYLLVDSFGHLLIAAVVVQLGISAFWVAYPALVHDVAEGKRHESWFALITSLRNAGLGVGALGASLAVAIGGTDGYTAIVAVNALSFAVAAILTRLDASGGTHAVSVNAIPGDDAPSAHTPTSGWASTLRDRPFLAFVVLNFGLALLSLAFGLGVPVFLVDTVHLPPWIPGTVLAVNAVLGAVGATPVGAAITGRSRSGGLMASQAIVGCAFVAVLCCAYVPSAFGVCLALAAVVLVTLGELVQSLIVSPIVNDCATAASRGRYNSLSQMAFSIGDVVTPALMTTLLAHGPAAAWIPLAALAAVNMLGIALLTNHLPALRRRVNHPGPTEPDRRG
ncbi:MFS transporter [Streptomyces iranensis]|uniref:MFS family permease n=1 Tax=Streptomyces iranensis TaxID=576784 RepID=A0A060ZCJ5_9ACTN|nr:MFS transporter [Streptomyces iranensis]MBP2068038.1 MFS family permease [Streptomyces iranensis]CDR02375.1 major facilitator superfamily MFS_1 [Streptomyces iranensis]